MSEQLWPSYVCWPCCVFSSSTAWDLGMRSSVDVGWAWPRGLLSWKNHLWTAKGRKPISPPRFECYAGPAGWAVLV